MCSITIQPFAICIDEARGFVGVKMMDSGNHDHSSTRKFDAFHLSGKL